MFVANMDKLKFSYYALSIKSAFTLIEMLIVIAVMAVLVSMLAPSLQRSLNLAKAVSCQSNLRQIYIGGIVPYTNNYNSYIPAPCQDYTNGGRAYWSNLLAGYLEIEQNSQSMPGGINWDKAKSTVYICSADEEPFSAPSSQEFAPSSYGANRINMSGSPYNPRFRLSSLKSPRQSGYLLDYNNIWYGAYNPYWNAWWNTIHNDAMNSLFLDGHAELMHPAIIPTSPADIFWYWQ